MNIRNWFIRNIWSKLPFGYICRFWWGGMRITFDTNLYVVTDKGRGTVKDAIPITLVSQECVDKISEEMESMSYGCQS